MSDKDRKNLIQERLTKMVLISLFLGLLVIFVIRNPAVQQDFQSHLLDLFLLAYATFRLGRLVAYDLVFEPIRAPFTITIPDPTGAGEDVEPRGAGMRRALGQLISCPICAGTWIAALLVYALVAFPGPTRIFLMMMAVVGVTEILNAVVEALSWSAQSSRKQAGIPSSNQNQASQAEQIAYVLPIENAPNGSVLRFKNISNDESNFPRSRDGR